MGGRGASSGTGKIGGVEITINGEKITYYFTKYKGAYYYQRDLASNPEKLPNNQTPKDIIDRAKSNGAEVKTFSESEKKRREKERRKERANRPDYELGYGTGYMREYSRIARRNRISTRVSRRK